MRSHAVLLHAGPTAGLRRRGRPGRQPWLFFAGLAGLIACVALAAILAHLVLEPPWIKRQVQSFARSSVGVDIDYRALRIHVLSGAEIEGLVVQSPAEVRPLAPDLARVGIVRAYWSPRSLLGRGPVIQRLSVSGVVLTVVVDDRGRTSLDALSRWLVQSPRLPLSRQTSRLTAPPPVGRVDVDDVAITLVRTQANRVLERTDLRGVGVSFSATPMAAAGWRVAAGLGSREQPLELSLTRAKTGAPADSVRAKLWLSLGAEPGALTATVDLRVLDQPPSSSASGCCLLHAEANARFDPTAGRTEIAVHDTQAGDGVATVDGVVEVADTGGVLLRHARGTVDIARLLAWLPADLAPVSVERARLRYEVESLSVGPVLGLSRGGALTVDADLARVDVRLEDGALAVTGGKVSLRAQPTDAGLAGQGSMELAGVRLDSGGNALGIEDLAVAFDGLQAADGTVAGRAEARFARAALEGAARVVARSGHVDLHAQNLRRGATALATRGDLSASLAVASLEARSAAARVLADGLTLRAHTLLEGHAPYAVQIESAASGLHVLGRDGTLLADAPARMTVSLRDAVVDAAHPTGSRGVAHATVDLGDVTTSLDVVKDRDAVDFSVRATATSLKDVRPLLSPALAAQAPWADIAVALRSTGRVEHLGGDAPSLQEATDVDVERPAFDRVSAQRLSLSVRSKGNVHRHEVEVDLRTRALTFDGLAPGDDHVTLAAALDRERRSLRLRLDTEGHLATELSASASFDPARHAVPYEVTVHAARLGPVGPLLAKVRAIQGFDLSRLEVGLSSRGTLVGLVADVGRDGVPRLEPSFARTAGIDGQVDVRASDVRWTRGSDAVGTKTLAWHGDLRVAGTRRTVDSHLDVDALHLALGPTDIDFTGIREDSSVVVSGDLSSPTTELTQHATVRTVRQNLAPEYPIGDVAFAVVAERERWGLVHVEELTLSNAAGGTSLRLSGNAELGAGRHSLALTAALAQDLARLSLAPEHFRGRGALALEASLATPDLSLLRVGGALKARDVFFALPRAGIEVEGVNGEVPVKVELALGHDGYAVEHRRPRSPYSILRFTDQQPLQRRSSALSIERVTSPFLSIAPLAGNLEVDQGMISLRQFEMGVRGGTVTGQGDLDVDGPRSTLDLHVRATGVQSAHGEPLDGNVAVVIAAADRSVEGRVEILRIGERQLLDLLDTQDPTHVDPAINSIRTALHFGHVDRLRVVFNHGFASAHLELGGLARFFRISDIDGMPVGPIVDRLLVPALDTAEGP